LRAADAKAQILRQSPAGKVPVLKADGATIWDSLAILEFIAETHPGSALWPQDRQARALARSVSAEMHSSFRALRKHCPMDFLARAPQANLPDAVRADVSRIVAIWRDCRARHGTEGPCLFGRFSVADAMYAPVASRFRTYLPDLTPYGDDGTATAYMADVLALPAMLAWEADARAEVA
jgi:glutathione S-transferase